jgi:HAMP domain-containing protein
VLWGVLLVGVVLLGAMAWVLARQSRGSTPPAE